MKKKIIISAFLLLILITAIAFIVGAIQSYNYDMDPANGVDILEGFGAAIALVVGGFVVFYKFDLFYTVYYFLIKQKTIAKSIINVLSNLTLLLIFFGDYLAYILYIHLNIFKEDWLLPITLFSIYAILRIIYAMLPNKQSVQETETKGDGEI